MNAQIYAPATKSGSFSPTGSSLVGDIAVLGIMVIVEEERFFVSEYIYDVGISFLRVIDFIVLMTAFLP